MELVLACSFSGMSNVTLLLVEQQNDEETFIVICDTSVL